MDTSPPPLAIFGDWHGHLGFALGCIDAAAQAGVQTLLHVGDFGLDFPGKERGRFERKISKRLESVGAILVLSPGNHDNWDTISKLITADDGTALFTESIRILPRGGRTRIGDLTIGGLGGAYSIDQQWRREGKDWWPNEEPTRDEAERLMSDGALDVLLTHDVPASVPMRGELKLPASVIERAAQTRTLLDEVVHRLRPPQVFAGHWHTRQRHVIPHSQGSITRVDVLGKELDRHGNGVLLRASESSPLVVSPLLISGR